MRDAGGVSAAVTGARERSGLTVGELAESLATTPDKVRAWEEGRSALTPPDLRRLNRLLAFTPADVALIEAETGIRLDLAVATGTTQADHLRRTTSPAWLAAAQELGCPFSGGGFQPSRIEGWLDSYRVVVCEVHRGASLPATRYRVGFEPLGLGLRMRRGDWASHVAARFSRSAVFTGTRSFDHLFVVRAEDRAGARALLTPSLTEHLVDIGMRMPALRISDAELTALGHPPRTRDDATVLVATIRELVAVVATFAVPPATRTVPGA